MFFVDGLGGYRPVAKLQGGGAQMGSDAMLGRLGGERLSPADEKIWIGCPRWLSETKKCGVGIQYERTNRKWKMCQKMRSGWFETGWALKYFRLHPSRITCVAESGPVCT